MKVGIFTTHFAINYGAVLQAYALRKTIEEMGHDCEIIDFTPPNNVDGRKAIYRFNNIKDSIFSLLLFFNYSYRKKKEKKVNKFDSFLEKNIKLSSGTYSTYTDLKKNMPFYDCLICGSDQVWNLNLFDEPAYFLQFQAEYPNTKYVAYAPSVAENLSSDQFEKIAHNIKHFDAVSLREQESAVKLSKYTNKKISSVLDPVLLLSKSEWAEIEEPLGIAEPYLLNYGIASGNKHSSVLNKIQKEKGLKLVDINLRPFNKHSAEYSLISLSLGNFLWLFRNADYVCTSSFHGTVFSILFEKDFTSVPDSLRSLRMENILKQLDLMNRLVGEKKYSNDNIDLSQIDYPEVKNKLSTLKKDSLKYLESAIYKENS